MRSNTSNLTRRSQGFITDSAHYAHVDSVLLKFSDDSFKYSKTQKKGYSCVSWVSWHLCFIMSLPKFSALAKKCGICWTGFSTCGTLSICVNISQKLCSFYLPATAVRYCFIWICVHDIVVTSETVLCYCVCVLHISFNLLSTYIHLVCGRIVYYTTRTVFCH